MSLSSFLLPGTSKGKTKAIDTGLDDLFRSTASVSLRSFLTCLFLILPYIQAPPIRLTVDVDPSATSVSPLSEKKRKATGAASNGKTKRPRVETAGV